MKATTLLNFVNIFILHKTFCQPFQLTFSVKIKCFANCECYWDRLKPGSGKKASKLFKTFGKVNFISLEHHDIEQLRMSNSKINFLPLLHVDDLVT